MVEDLHVCPLHGLLFRWNSLIHSRAMGSWNSEGKRIICWVPALCQALSTESGSCGEGVWALVGLCRRNVCRNVSSFPVSVFVCILIQINLFKNSLTYLFFLTCHCGRWRIGSLRNACSMLSWWEDSAADVLTSIWHSKTVYSKFLNNFFWMWGNRGQAPWAFT